MGAINNNNKRATQMRMAMCLEQAGNQAGPSKHWGADSQKVPGHHSSQQARLSASKRRSSCQHERHDGKGQGGLGTSWEKPLGLEGGDQHKDSESLRNQGKQVASKQQAAM